MQQVAMGDGNLMNRHKEGLGGVGLLGLLGSRDGDLADGPRLVQMLWRLGTRR